MGGHRPPFGESEFIGGEVPQRTSSHLTTIVSRALQSQDAGFYVPWTEILDFFKLHTLILRSFLDNVEIIVNKICF